MFDSKQTLTQRLGNATDLLIDFATLGEYGLEPVGSAPEGDGADRAAERRPCETNRRTQALEAHEFTDVLFPNRRRGADLQATRQARIAPRPSRNPSPATSKRTPRSA